MGKLFECCLPPSLHSLNAGDTTSFTRLLKMVRIKSDDSTQLLKKQSLTINHVCPFSLCYYCLFSCGNTVPVSGSVFKYVSGME